MSRKTRKLIWSAPLVAVLAVAGALAMFAAQGTGSVFANPLPGVPMNVEANPASGVAGRTTLVLTWDAVADADGYRIDVSDDSFVWETRVGKDDPHTSTTYTDYTLTASDVRWYRVFAVNSHGEGPVSDPAEGMTNVKGKPGPVENFTATAIGQREIKLSWDPPADNGGELITGYEIQYYKVDGAQATNSDWFGLQSDGTGTAGDGAVPYLVVSEADRMKNGGYADKDTAAAGGSPGLSLDPGDMRIYRIRAVNGDLTAVTADDRTDAEAPNTMDGWVRADATTAAATAPTAPTGLTAVNTGGVDGDANGYIALYWFAPEIMNNGGWPVTDYLIQVRRAETDWPDIPEGDDLKDLTDTAKAGGTITAGGENFRVPVADTYTELQKNFTNVPDTYDADGDPTTTDDNATPLWLEFRVFAMTTDDGADDMDDGADDTGDDDTLIIGTSASETSARVRAVARVLTDADGDDQTDDADAYGPPTLYVTGSDDGTNQPDGNGPALEQEIQIALEKPTGVGTQNVYRIDYSEDGGNTWKLLTGRTTFTGFDGARRFQHTGLPFDEAIEYRAFALRSNWRTTAGPVSDMVDGATVASTAPGKVTGVMASSPDAMTIEASWIAPAKDGGQPIVKYQYQYVMDDRDGESDLGDWAQTGDDVPSTPADTADADLMETIEELSLMKGDLYHLRVRAVNMEAGEREDDGTAPNVTEGPWSDGASFIAGGANPPNMVEGITSEPAKDSTGNVTGVDVLWNAPSEGAEVDTYEIERSMDMGETWEHPTTDAEASRSSKTAYTDPRHYVAGETLVYRVRAVNAAGESGWSMVYYPRDPDMGHAPGKPMGVTAEKDSAMPTSQIDVSWSAPANGANVNGYIIERRYTGDMMGDIPSDGYNAGVMGASHAFMDYQEWWETLNCKGMLAVAGSSASDTATEGESAQDIADRGMYCKHFANTAPTNMAFEGKTVSEATAMKIKEMFMKRYVTNDMGKTMTMFPEMMYADMGLMEDTEYTYRVRAIHGMDAGMWSDTAMAMTESGKLDELSNVRGTQNGNIVTIEWDGAENADTFTVVMITRKDDGSWDIPNAVYDQNLKGSPHTVDMATRPAGNYIIGVAAGTEGGEWTNWKTGEMDYQP